MAQVIRLELLQMLKISYIVSLIRSQIITLYTSMQEAWYTNMTSYVQLLWKISNMRCGIMAKHRHTWCRSCYLWLPVVQTWQEETWWWGHCLRSFMFCHYFNSCTISWLRDHILTVSNGISKVCISAGSHRTPVGRTDFLKSWESVYLIGS